MARRHATLIPLSHQHQHALALVVIIRRRFGIEKGEKIWREEQVGKIQKAWKAELKGHFEVPSEEKTSTTESSGTAAETKAVKTEKVEAKVPARKSKT